MENIRIQDDLYESVNGSWLKDAKIPADRPTAGGFSELDINVEKLLMNDFKEFNEGKKETSIKEMNDAILIYKKVLDVNKRNSDGIKPLLEILEFIDGIKDINDLNNKLKDLLLNSLPLPFECGVTADMRDAKLNSFIILGPSIILPDTTYYEKDNEAGKALLSIWQSMAENALKFTNLTEEEQKIYLKDTLEFDSLIAKKVKSQLEWADYVKNNNPMNLDDVSNYLKPLDFKKFLKSLYDKLPKEVIVYDLKAIKEFNFYFNENNFILYKHWAYVKTLIQASNFLSEEMYEISTTYKKALTGVEKNPVIEKQAYQLASRLFSEPIGVYYGRTYFGEEAKKDIISLVKKIIDMYKIRVKNNEFLENKTKEKAILKLSTIEIKMGYPDFINKVYEKINVKEEDSLLKSYLDINKILLLNNFDKLYKPVDRTEWQMPGHMVNACYNPSSNDITFPAAILQKPFYSIDQSISENLGGIGAVIGHEISHAFDNNGAQFDEFGNLCNWWSEKDYNNFLQLTQKMIEQFDGIEYHNGKVNGELVVSENIADNGGMAVTLAIMHTIKEADFEKYFKNWAKIWCMKAKEEYIALLLTNDVHSPAKLRANIPPRNFNEWYETFNVCEKDLMYIEKDKRIIIW